MIRPILAIALLAFSMPACQSAPPATFVAGATPAPLRSISVTGTAEIAAAPDEFTISVGAESYASEAQAAKEANDHTMKALIAAAGRFADPKDVRTEGFILAPRYEGSYETRRLNGYDAKKTLVVVLHDSEKVEALLAELFKGGANRLDGVTYGSTTIIDQRKQARTMAVAAAREKAQSMAASLGQKLGRPVKIDEDTQAGRYPLLYGNQLGNAYSQTSAPAAVGEAMATGKMRVSASVNVTFEIVD